jgi:hypothetical protein
MSMKDTNHPDPTPRKAYHQTVKERIENPCPLRLVRQFDSWSCYACVAAMATQTKLQDVIDFVGHDGSEIDPNSKHPDKRRGFDLLEISKFMAHHGRFFGAVGANINGYDASFVKKFDCIEISIPLSHPAMVTVSSTMSKFDGNHCLYWDGKDAWDPYYDKPVDLDDYILNEWWPLVWIE